jgi:hypothetical protein
MFLGKKGEGMIKRILITSGNKARPVVISKPFVPLSLFWLLTTTPTFNETPEIASDET